MRFCSRKSAMAADGSCESSCSPAVDQTIPGLRKALHACSKAVESGDLSISSRAAEELALYLHSVSELVLSDQEDEDLKRKAFEVLSEIHGYLCASTDEAFVDAISGFLPKEVSKLSIASEKCLRIAERIIDKLIEVCGARFMLPILAGAFAYPDEEAHNPKYFAPLLHGISAAFLSIGRRQFENIKTALPVILTSLEDISRDPNVETADLILLFQRTLSVSTSIRYISEGNMHDKLRALLTLFILQIMALVSISMGHEVSICLPLMVQLTPLFSHCGLSYLGCITGTDVDKTKGILFEECVEEEYVNEMSCFSLARHGACLVVIWGHISNAVSESAKRDLSDLKNTLRINQEQRWQSIVTLKNIFSCSDLPWELKKQGMDFLLGITESGGASAGSTKEPVDSSHYITSLYGALQSIEILMMSAPDAALRKNAYEAMKRILADITPSHRLDVMKALITSSRASSMTALLINLVREEMHKEQKRVNGEISPGENGTFWSNSGILEIVENVLRPQGGPPSVLEDSDAVLSALNLYRYILLTEHNGKSNRTGVLSETNLRRAYDEWLLPLRTLVTALMADDDVSVEYSCGLNPLELVLYRCIELVEEQLKNP